MKIALFVGHNLVAQTFTRLLLASAFRPVAVLRPTFAGSSQLSGVSQHDVLALTVNAETTPGKEPGELHHLPDADGPVEIHAGPLDAQVQQQLGRLNPDLIVSVCYPRKLPVSLLSLANLGGLNLHPSPLPSWRGNDPIFWQLRAGCSDIGLSWHRMTDVLDAGVVVASDRIALLKQMSAEDLDCKIAERGLALLTEMLCCAEMDFFRSHSSYGVDRGRYFPSPVEQDYRIWTSWSTDHVERFVGLLQSRGVRFRVHTATMQFAVSGLFDAEKDAERDRVVVDMADGAVAFLK